LRAFKGFGEGKIQEGGGRGKIKNNNLFETQ